MSYFQIWLRELFSPRKITHDFFGMLRFLDMPDPSKAYWEGEVVVDGLGRVGIGIHASADGPAEKQVAFFKYWMENLPDLIEEIRPRLQPEFEGSNKKPLAGRSIFREWDGVIPKTIRGWFD
jgi:hypothetical protein